MQHRLLILLVLFSTSVFSQSKERLVSGVVTDGDYALETVNITIKNSTRGTTTDADGKYQINALPGEILVYSYTGKQTREIVVEDVTRVLNVVLYDEFVELDEVVVTKSKRRRTQKDLRAEYNTNKNLVKTIFGILDKETASFSMQLITSDDNISHLPTLELLLQSRIPGLLVTRDSRGRLLAFLPRSNNSINNRSPVTFEVDGLIFNEVPEWVIPADVERLAVIQSLVMSQRYGRGSIVVINTKSLSLEREADSSLYDQALLRDNYYKAGDAKKVVSSVPRYLEVIQQTSTADAQETFNSLESSYGSSPYFYIDLFTYFSKENPSMASKVFDRAQEKYRDNAMVLKALAFTLEANDQHEKALPLYEQIYRLRPQYQQSYFDLARAYERLDQPENAARIYARYYYLVKEKKLTVSEKFGPIMARDFTRFLDQIKGQNFAQTITVSNEETDFKGTRLLFEWSDSEAEFELQFVNPGQQYYISSHSYLENQDAVLDAKVNGYSSQEYLIYELNGPWQVNATYLGNKSLTPTYLKVTVQYNYGTAQQKDEVRVFRMYVQEVNQKLFSLP